MTKENYNEAQSQIMKFNEVGDFIKGTLIGVSKRQSADAYGKISTIFTIKSKEGKFLGSTKNEKTGKSKLDDKPTEIKEGEEYILFADGILAGLLKKIRIGQKFMVKLTELKPTTKGNDAKIKKVFPGTDDMGQPLLDAEWIEEQKTKEDGEFKDFE